MNEQEMQLKEAELVIREKKLQDLAIVLDQRIKSGNAEAGTPPEVKKPETPVEYKNRILREMSL